MFVRCSKIKDRDKELGIYESANNYIKNLKKVYISDIIMKLLMF
jgi:hypothetical protein